MSNWKAYIYLEGILFTNDKHARTLEKQMLDKKGYRFICDVGAQSRDELKYNIANAMNRNGFDNIQILNEDFPKGMRGFMPFNRYRTFFGYKNIFINKENERYKKAVSRIEKRKINKL